MAEITNAESLRAWLKTRPREDAVLIASRAALRVLPVLGSALREDAQQRRAAIMLPCFRAMAVASVAGKWPTLATGVRDAAYVAAADARAVGAADADAAAHAAYAAAAPTTSGADAAARVAARAAATTSGADRTADGATIWRSVTQDAAALEKTGRQLLAETSLWPGITFEGGVTFESGVEFDGMPEWARGRWQELKTHLLAANEGWDVWTDWYDALLEGRPQDPDLELAKALIPDDVWQQGPAAANAEIARLIAEHHADRPQGETLEYDPPTNQVGIGPALVEDPDAVENAVSQLEDALDDFRNSPVANRAYVLNPVVRRLDRMLERHRENPRRVHDDLVRAARDIARAIDSDPDIDEIPTRDLRDVCGQGAIDVRIASKAVSEMEADRRRRTARQPSANAQSAAQRLLAEVGEGLSPELRDEMQEDVEAVVQSGAGEGDELPDSAARDAMLRITARFGWLHRFARMSHDRVVALAQQTGKTVDDVETIVTLFKNAKGWWGVIEWLMNVV